MRGQECLRQPLTEAVGDVRERVNRPEGLRENDHRVCRAMRKPASGVLRTGLTRRVARSIAGAAEFDPAVAGQDAKKASFRVNRDFRLSKEGVPYKTPFAVEIAAGGKRNPGSRARFHVDHAGALLAAGCCFMSPAYVRRTDGPFKRPFPRRNRAERRHRRSCSPRWGVGTKPDPPGPSRAAV